jgi:hypothetical protein
VQDKPRLAANALHQVFANARGYREEATRARKLAETACGQLQSKLLEIAALYEVLAAVKIPTRFEATSV